MKKAVILDGSMRHGYTESLAGEIVERLSSVYQVDLIHLKDLQFHPCTGCCACLIAGSSRCPLAGDDVRTVLQAMMAADGIIIVVPNYSLQVPGQTKILLDRLAYVFHRPRMFHKVFMPMVVQGVYGGGDIRKYLCKVMRFWGTRNVKGAVFSGGLYTRQIGEKLLTPASFKKLDLALQAFTLEMSKTTPKKPSLFQVLLFRSTRSSMMYFPEATPADKKYYETNGWNQSSYYYPVRLGVVKYAVGYLVDRLMKRMAKKTGETHEMAQ